MEEKEIEIIGTMNKVVKLDNLREAVEFLERSFGKRVDFDTEISSLGRYRAKMYKVSPRIIRIDLVKENEK